MEHRLGGIIPKFARRLPGWWRATRYGTMYVVGWIIAREAVVEQRERWKFHYRQALRLPDWHERQTHLQLARLAKIRWSNRRDDLVNYGKQG